MIPLDLPDEPRWVEAHGIAGDPTSWHRPLGAGFAIGNEIARLVVIAGDVDSASAIGVGRAHPDHVVLVGGDDLAAALRGSGRTVERAILHTLADPAALPDLEGALPLPPDASLAHVPPALAEELEIARARGTVWTAYLDGEPAAFAYAPWRSARYFDVSVDTLASARQLGLGSIVASAMIRGEHDRQPVWGANASNAASLRLAKRLGFVAVDELWVAAP
ncbi:MAG: GNAT family N-acetyltransferase [Kofleriaceae bacterium]